MAAKNNLCRGFTIAVKKSAWGGMLRTTLGGGGCEGSLHLNVVFNFRNFMYNCFLCIVLILGCIDRL